VGEPRPEDRREDEQEQGASPSRVVSP
jgi:hypothetical protein